MRDESNGRGLSRKAILFELDQSLKRLQTDHIDLYQMHHVDRRTPWEEIWQAMETLVEQGKILYVGSSNFAGWHIATAQEVARHRNFLGLVSEQSLYNLMERSVELEVLPSAEYHGLGVIPWSPLHGGLLGGVIRKTEEGRRRTTGRAAEALEENRAQIQEFEDFCDKLGQAPGTVALAWLLHQPAVTAPIVGPRTDAQFASALDALDVKLSAEELARLDEIFPGHKTAPEDYAW
jgi:aryl-alcohol dehydrogenase-like predicted oxidoreductase